MVNSKSNDHQEYDPKSYYRYNIRGKCDIKPDFGSKIVNNVMHKSGSFSKVPFRIQVIRNTSDMVEFDLIILSRLSGYKRFICYKINSKGNRVQFKDKYSGIILRADTKDQNKIHKSNTIKMTYKSSSATFYCKDVEKIEEKSIKFGKVKHNNNIKKYKVKVSYDLYIMKFERNADITINNFDYKNGLINLTVVINYFGMNLSQTLDMKIVNKEKPYIIHKNRYFSYIIECEDSNNPIRTMKSLTVINNKYPNYKPMKLKIHTN